MTTFWMIVVGVALVCSTGFGVWLTQYLVRLSAPVEPAAPTITTDDMEPLIRDAAKRWAAAYGHPEAAALVADKLRTLHRLTYEQTALLPGGERSC